MSIESAAAILRLIGPSLVRIDARHAALAAELALSGCALARQGQPAPVAILDWQAALQPQSSAGAERLVLLPGPAPRGAILPRLFAAGWERHPAGLNEFDYPGLDDQALGLTLLRRAGGAQASPLRGDAAGDHAALARFALAARLVRAGDRALVDGPHAATGVEILAAQSRAGACLTIAGHDGARDADFIAAFGAGGDWRARLDDYATRLKPDGRLLAGWRAGEGPADLAELSSAMAGRFIREALFAHAVPGEAGALRRTLRRLEGEATAPDEKGWLIVCLSVDPLDRRAPHPAFRHPAFEREGATAPASADFSRAYDDPFLYRSMIQLGERLMDDMALAEFAERVIDRARPGSPDRGAAIAALGYRVLEMRHVPSIGAVMGLIAAFREEAEGEDNLHSARWSLSLAFLAGRLAELAGEPDGAQALYDECAAADWRAFSPILATKAIAAAFFAARIALAKGDVPTARAFFRRGVETGLEAAACAHEEHMGGLDSPLPFYLPELAEVLDMAGQCGNALANLHLFERDPGLFWRQADVKRFGLASWARDLERENARLRAGRG